MIEVRRSWPQRIFLAVLVGSVAMVPIVNAQNSLVELGQATGNSDTFKLYGVPSNLDDINSSIADVLQGCTVCSQVERSWESYLSVFDEETNRHAMMDNCHLRSDLVEQSNLLSVIIERAHEARDWPMEQWRKQQQRYQDCARRLLEYRIDIASQIINTLLQ